MTTETFFYGGHSLGGASIASWGASATDAEGIFAWGAYVNKGTEDPAKNYNVPFMTVGAELDGWMARISRIALSYDQMVSSSIGYENSKYTYPVVVIPGISHASFLSGIPPPTV